MKITSENLDIIKVLEEDEPGKWLEGRDLKYLDLGGQKISINGDAPDLIREDPELILRAIRLSGEIIMDIDDKTKEVLKKEAQRLKTVPRNKRRDHFIGIITSNDAEKALGYVRDLGMLEFLFGDISYRTASKRTLSDVDIVINNINKARPEFEHRFTLLLRPFGSKNANQIMSYLIIDRALGEKVHQAIKLVDKVYFLKTKMELKKFIKKYGYDNYVFIDKIARQEKKIYDRMDYKVESRYYMLEEAKTYEEAMHVEDLAIDANDLIREGIAKDKDEADKLLEMVLDFVLIKPKNNTEKFLLKKASQVKHNPFVKHTRKVWWRR